MTYSYTDLLALFGIGGAHPGGLALTREILNELSINKRTMFLDVGCGTGQTTNFIMSNYPCQLFAVDNHPLMIRKIKKRFQSFPQKVQILEASTEKLPFENQMFHYILSESVTSFTNIRESVNEYFRILKDEGELIMIEMTEIQALQDNEAKELMEFYHLKQLFTEDKWIATLNASGFTEVKAFTINLDELITDDQVFTEFDLNDQISPELYNILQQHEQLSLKFKEKLGFRVFICKKH